MGIRGGMAEPGAVSDALWKRMGGAAGKMPAGKTVSIRNAVEGGGMFGYEAVIDGLKLMREAYTEKKDMRSLVQIKGMGCGCCS